MKQYKLNDLFYFAKDELKMALYTDNNQHVVKAFYFYKQYKDRGGKKTIDKLEIYMNQK